MSNDRLSNVNSQVPQGYKQTEVGLIPEDWNVSSLSNFASVGSGGTPSRSIPEYWNGEIPWLTTTQIDFNIINSANEFITKEGLKNSAAKVYEAGTLLMAMYGQGKTRGKVAIMGFPASINQACAALSIADSVSKLFVFHNLSSRYQEIRELSNTGNQENLNSYLIKNILLALPPNKDEQEAIAQALSDTDALIGSLEQLIAKKRHIKQGAMQELLTGKQRLPDFDGEWQVNKLGDVAEIIMGQSPNSSCYNIQGKGLPLIQGNADISNRKTIKRIFTTEITKKGNCGDILMSVRAPVGEISRAIFDVCLGRGVCSIRNGSRNEFLYHYLIWREPDWVGLSKGSTFDSVNSADVKTFQVFIPVEISEQNAIATILSDMDTAIAVLEEKLTKTRQLKQGMMHQLLTGKIRLLEGTR
jgi:type I restriction enzyme, S subunit